MCSKTKGLVLYSRFPGSLLFICLMLLFFNFHEAVYLLNHANYLVQVYISTVNYETCRTHFIILVI